MYEIANTFLKSELDYRSDRIRSGLASSKGRRDHSRVFRVRRAESSDTSR